MQTYRFTLTGITPLIMHSNDILERDRITAVRRKLKDSVPGDDRSPADTWKGYLYHSESSGNVCIPTENLLACLLHAGAKVKTRGKETLKSHSQRVGFTAIDFDLAVNGQPLKKAALDKITGEFVEHADAVRKLGFRLNLKPVTVGTAKHIRVRPYFPVWGLVGDFEIDDDDQGILSLSALRELFAAAGKYAGLGDWRPSAPKRPGRYGRFTATIEKV